MATDKTPGPGDEASGGQTSPIPAEAPPSHPSPINQAAVWTEVLHCLTQEQRDRLEQCRITDPVSFFDAWGISIPGSEARTPLVAAHLGISEVGIRHIERILERLPPLPEPPPIGTLGLLVEQPPLPPCPTTDAEP